MEVSMPTGSLCAERNVIGSALAADLTLRREDIRYVAVLSLSLEPPTAVSVLCHEYDPTDIATLGESFDSSMSPLSLKSETAARQVSSCSETSHSLDELPVRPADMKRAQSQPVVFAPHLSHKLSNGSSTPNKTKMVNVFDFPPLQTPVQQSTDTTHRSRESSSRKAAINTSERRQSAGKEEVCLSTVVDACSLVTLLEMTKIRTRDSMRSAIREIPHNRIAVEERYHTSFFSVSHPLSPLRPPLVFCYCGSA
jgi:hypothetical protein